MKEELENDPTMQDVKSTLRFIRDGKFTTVANLARKLDPTTVAMLEEQSWKKFGPPLKRLNHLSKDEIYDIATAA